MMNQKSLSIIIVNYKNYELTNKCIDSVIDNMYSIKDYEIIVIDNNSPNESYEEIEKKFGAIDNISIIKNSINAGFGAANNLGAKKAKGEYVLFLNPDILIVDNALEKMLEKIKEDSEIGLLSGKLLNDVVRRIPTTKIEVNANIAKIKNELIKLIADYFNLPL